MGSCPTRIGLVLLLFALGGPVAGQEVAREGQGSGIGTASLPIARAEPTALDMSSAALLMSGQTGGDLPIATSLRWADGRIELDLEVAFEAERIATPSDNDRDNDRDSKDRDSKDRRAPAEIFVYLLGQDLEVLRAATFRIALQDEVLVESFPGLRLCLTLEPAAESAEYRPLLRVLVRSGESLALRSLMLPMGATHVPTPRFRSGDGWIDVEPTALGQEASLVAPRFSARPTLRAGASYPMIVDSAASTISVPLAGIVEDASGELFNVEILAAEALETESPMTPLAGPSAPQGWAHITLPAELAPGPARLTLLDETPGLEDAGAPPTAELWVIKAAALEEPWPRFLIAAEDASARPELRVPRVPQPAEVEAAARELRLERFGALAQTSTVMELASQLRDIENRLIGELGPAAARLLHELERRFLKALERRPRRAESGRVLVAWAFAHYRLGSLHRQDRRHALANQAQGHALTALRRAAVSGLEDEVARFMALIAHGQQTRGRLMAARRLFEEALGHANADPFVLYAYALNLERLGENGEAAEVFARVRESEAPGFHDAGLRQGVNLMRAGRRSEAREIFRSLTRSTGEQSWLARLAYQELARLDLGMEPVNEPVTDTAALERALLTLEKSLERFPKDQHLSMARARALDRLGRRAEARKILDALSDGSDASPRTRYNDWPRADFSALEDRLQAAADRHLEPLRTLARRRLERMGGGS